MFDLSSMIPIIIMFAILLFAIGFMIVVAVLTAKSRRTNETKQLDLDIRLQNIEHNVSYLLKKFEHPKIMTNNLYHVS